MLMIASVNTADPRPCLHAVDVAVWLTFGNLYVQSQDGFVAHGMMKRPRHLQRSLC